MRDLIVNGKGVGIQGKVCEDLFTYHTISYRKKSTECMYNIQYTIYNIQYAICNMQYAICNIQYTICNMQYTIYNMQYTIYNMRAHIQK
jgi:hypothetical protein